MISKYSLITAIILVCDGVLSAPAIGSFSLDSVTSINQLFELLDKLGKYETSRSQDVYSSESMPAQSQVKPIPAPPPTPALGDIVPPVKWPFPPAPYTGGDNEFPLLERFKNANNIQSNNHISSSQNQWSAPPPPSPSKPAPRPDPVITNSWTPIGPINTWIPPKPAPVSTPVDQWTPSRPQDNLNGYVEYGLLKPQSIPSMSSVPPPLNPNDHFQVQHNSNNGGQQRHFRLDSVRMSDQSEKRDKLNVSFIMPPDVKPLTLNFDSGEVVIDTGDKTTRYPVEKVSGPKYKSIVSDLESILSSTAGNSQTAQSGVTSLSGSNYGREDNDDDYIVVRHDSNKYAYNVPKSQSVGSAADTSATSGNTPTTQVEKYDVSGEKNLRFVLGRVSG